MSLKLYGALGESNSKYLFVHFPAGSFFGQQKELADNTHHSTYGGYELSRCVVEGIRAELPGLAKDLREDAGTFDPIKPDTQERVALPPTPILGENDTPDGN
jgi:hypothetical protein